MERPALICKGELLLGLRYIRNQLFGFGGEKVVNYCLIYGTSETKKFRKVSDKRVNYYLDYRTSETMTPLRVGGAR